MHGLLVFYGVLLAIAGVGVLAGLYTLANRLAWELELHALKVETRRLRAAYERRMAAMRAGQMAEVNVDVVEPELGGVDVVGEAA